MDWTQALESRGIEHGSGASQSEIDRAEEALCVRFPQDYRVFLSRFGWVDEAHLIVIGAGPDVPVHLDVVKETMCERYRLMPYTPAVYVPISPDGAGNQYCIDCRLGPDGPCPIVFWDHEAPEMSAQIPDVHAPSFNAWLIETLDEVSRDEYD